MQYMHNTSSCILHSVLSAKGAEGKAVVFNPAEYGIRSFCVLRRYVMAAMGKAEVKRIAEFGYQS